MRLPPPLRLGHLAAVCASLALPAAARADTPRAFIERHCVACHGTETKEAGLDLGSLSWQPDDADNRAAWVKIHDRVRAGEMPAADAGRPDAREIDAAMASLAGDLRAAEAARIARDGRSRLRRLNRVEFENTLRDLLALPGLKLKENLPEDGRAHGFDRLADALDLSFVHVESYLAAVDKALNAALCPLPEAPPRLVYRYRPWDNLERPGGLTAESVVTLSVREKIGLGLIGLTKDETFVGEYAAKPSPPFPQIRDEEPKATAYGFFRHEDADHRFSLHRIQPYVSGRYALRVSGYSFDWDGRQVVPTDRHGALGWGIYAKNELLGMVDLPPNAPATREVTAWLERGGGMIHGTDDHLRLIGASLQNVRDFAHGKNKDVPGPLWPVPGVAIEWVEIDGPINDEWPPASHRALFGDLPVKVWTPELDRPKPTQQVWPNGNPHAWPKDVYGERGDKRPVVYVESSDPAVDAERLLATFLKRAFRRPVTAEEVADYAAIVRGKLDSGAAFEDAMRAAYREALTSPEFLLVQERPGRLDDHALAARLSYFLWSSLPDAELTRLADEGKLSDPLTLRAQAERMLGDPKGARFVDNFLGQWLSLRDISDTEPDRKLYPEYMPWLQEAMLREARAYFGELLTNDLGVARFVKSDFATINEPLARLYGIDGVRGWDIRRVPLPADSPRGGFLTMAAVLKTTANGTTTSPVKRGAFVMEKLLGVVPTPPPPDAGSVEPDTRGTTTIREQLDKHKHQASCAGCHRKMDGYGFALESFDVIGGPRTRYRATGVGAIDGSDEARFLHGRRLEYHDGPPVECQGLLPDGRAFDDVRGLRDLLAGEPERLATAFTGHLVTYATGAEIGFGDRAEVDRIVRSAAVKNYGLRTLFLEVVQSELFRQK